MANNLTDEQLMSELDNLSILPSLVNVEDSEFGNTLDSLWDVLNSEDDDIKLRDYALKVINFYGNNKCDILYITDWGPGESYELFEHVLDSLEEYRQEHPIGLESDEDDEYYEEEEDEDDDEDWEDEDLNLKLQMAKLDSKELNSPTLENAVGISAKTNNSNISTENAFILGIIN